MADIEKTMMAMVVAIFGFAVISQVVQAGEPAAPSYCCPIPICDLCFYTYDELYAHFVSAHPSEPIEIIWD